MGANVDRDEVQRVQVCRNENLYSYKKVPELGKYNYMKSVLTNVECTT